MATTIPAIQAYLKEKDDLAKAQSFATFAINPDAEITTKAITMAAKNGAATLSSAEFGRYLLSWFQANVSTYAPDVIEYAEDLLGDALTAANSEAVEIGLETPPGPVLPKPYIMSALTLGAQVNVAVHYQISAAHMSAMFTNNTRVFSATGLPAGLVVDTVTGVISGTITDSAYVAQSPITITIGAENDNGVTTAEVVITVLPAVPVVTYPTSSTVVTIIEETEISTTTFTANTFGASNLAWSLTGTLPEGLGFNTQTGVLSGTPIDGTAGTTQHTVMAITEGGSSAPVTFSITVNAN